MSVYKPARLPLSIARPPPTVRSRLSFMRALGPLTVCILSIALMNIFKWCVPQTKGRFPDCPTSNLPCALHQCATKGTNACRHPPSAHSHPPSAFCFIWLPACLPSCPFLPLRLPACRYDDYNLIDINGKETKQKYIADIGKIPKGGWLGGVGRWEMGGHWAILAASWFGAGTTSGWAAQALAGPSSHPLLIAYIHNACPQHCVQACPPSL